MNGKMSQWLFGCVVCLSFALVAAGGFATEGVALWVMIGLIGVGAVLLVARFANSEKRTSFLKSSAWRGLFIVLTLFYAQAASAGYHAIPLGESNYYETYPHDFDGTYYAVLIESSGSMNAKNISIVNAFGNTGHGAMAKILGEYGLRFDISSPEIGQSLTITVKFFESDTNKKTERTFTFKVAFVIDGPTEVTPYENVVYSINEEELGIEGDCDWSVPEEWPILGDSNKANITVVPGGNTYSGKITVTVKKDGKFLTSEPLIVKMASEPEYCDFQEFGDSNYVDVLRVDGGGMHSSECDTKTHTATIDEDGWEIDYSRHSGTDSDGDALEAGIGVSVNSFFSTKTPGYHNHSLNETTKSHVTDAKVCRGGWFAGGGSYSAKHVIYGYSCDEEGWLGKPEITSPANNSCFSGSVMLEATPAKADYYQYEWFKGGTKVATTNVPEYEATEGGTYEVRYHAGANDFEKSDLLHIKKAPSIVSFVQNGKDVSSPVATMGSSYPLPDKIKLSDGGTHVVSSNGGWYYYVGSQKVSVTEANIENVTYYTSYSDGCTTEAALEVKLNEPANAQYVSGWISKYVITGTADNQPYSWKITDEDDILAECRWADPVPDGSTETVLAEKFANGINNGNNFSFPQKCNLTGSTVVVKYVAGNNYFEITSPFNAKLYVGLFNQEANCLVDKYPPFCAYNPSIKKMDLVLKCALPPQNMLVQYKLDDNADDTYINNPTSVIGKVDNALSFDGSNYVEIPHHSELNVGDEDFSVTAWVKTAQTSGFGTILSKGSETQGYALYINDGNIGFRLATDRDFFYTSNSSIANDNEWHLVTVTVDRDNPEGGLIYVDGNLVKVFDPTDHTVSLDNNEPLRIASSPIDGVGLFQGLIDEVAIFNTVLEQYDIGATFQADNNGICKVEEAEPSTEPTLSVKPSFENVPASSDNVIFNLANAGNGTMDWTASSDAQWLTIDSGASGTDSGAITVSYDANSGEARTGTITVTAPGAENSPQTVEVRQAESFPLAFSIQATAGSGGTISPAGAVTVDSGADQTFTITPDTCYTIADVLVDGSSVGAVSSYSFTNVTEDHTIEAVFSQKSITITAQAGTGGTILPSGDVSASCGDEPTFSIKADDCYQIESVTVDGNPVDFSPSARGTVGFYTFPGVTANHTIEAVFSQKSLTITARAGTGGRILPSGDVSASCGDEPRFSIKADDCYQIESVTVDGNPVDFSPSAQGTVGFYTFQGLTADHSIEAVFSQKNLTITATPGTGGRISPAGDVTVACGEDREFAITPDAGYKVEDVLVDDVSIGDVTAYTFANVTSDHRINVRFTPEEDECVDECIIDLENNTHTCQDISAISFVSQPANHQAVVKINLDPDSYDYTKAVFEVTYNAEPDGWTVDICDSKSCNGYGGDGGDTSNAAEVEVIDTSFNAYRNTLHGHPDDTGEPLKLFTKNSLEITQGTTVSLEISDERVGWDFPNEQGESESDRLFTLNGQTPTYGTVNYDIYAAFNRVISGTYRNGSGAKSVLIKLVKACSDELCPDSTCHIAQDGSDETGYGSEAEPFATIQHGIDVAEESYTVLVHPGTYVENLKVNVRNITLKSADGAEKTVIDGNRQGTVLAMKDVEEAVIDGFTITNGDGQGPLGGLFYYIGPGGVSILNSTPIIKNLIVTDNVSHDGGGVSCSLGASPTLINVQVTNNTSDVGGGIYIDGIGDGVCNMTLQNVTVTDNHSLYEMGGGLFSHSLGKLNAVNSVLWNNTPDNIHTWGTPEFNIIYSDMQDGWDGEGNINMDPLFADATTGDYHLSADSPCIDAGTPDDAPETDLEGNERLALPDMGAYESVATCPAELSVTPRLRVLPSRPGHTFTDITNTGCGSADWNANAYTLGSSGWLSVTPGSGTTDANLRANFSGNYSWFRYRLGIIRVTADAENSPGYSLLIQRPGFWWWWLARVAHSSSGMITAGQTVKKSVALSSGSRGPVIFKVRWPGSDLDLVITTPSGKTLTPSSPEVSGYYEGDTEEFYIVESDEQGTWDVDIVGIETEPDGEPYEFSVIENERSEPPTEDTDGDGLPDAWEENFFGDLSNDGTGDEDNDGLTDLEEYENNINPSGTDTDEDGLPDAWEVAYAMDPADESDAEADSDGDGVSNVEEYEADTDPNDPDSHPDDPYCSYPGACYEFNAGVFTVNETGKVKSDWLFDGGAYQGELGIFSLYGMDNIFPGSPEFIEEAARRALSGTEEGCIVLSDRTEGARFSGPLGGGSERERNSGPYKGLRTCAMTPGDTFATILVPNSTLENLFQNPDTTNPHLRPIFSLASPNPEHGMYFGQIAEVEDAGKAFVYEDMLLSSGSDRDYNDLIVRITGITVSVPTLDNPELGFEKDWRIVDNPLMPHIRVSPPDPETLWVVITLKSPADLIVYDPEGRVIGKQGGYIPGATFEYDENGHQIVTLPALESGKYRIVLQAIGDGGLCHLEVKGYQGADELSSLEKPFTIGPGEVFSTTVSGDAFTENMTVTFDAPENHPEDFDKNGMVDDSDIETVSSGWNLCEGDPGFDASLDLDSDGCVTILDIMAVVNKKE